MEGADHALQPPHNRDSNKLAHVTDNGRNPLVVIFIDGLLDDGYNESIDGSLECIAQTDTKHYRLCKLHLQCRNNSHQTHVDPTQGGVHFIRVCRLEDHDSLAHQKFISLQLIHILHTIAIIILIIIILVRCCNGLVLLQQLHDCSFGGIPSCNPERLDRSNQSSVLPTKKAEREAINCDHQIVRQLVVEIIKSLEELHIQRDHCFEKNDDTGPHRRCLLNVRSVFFGCFC
mmetsp:Transcript_37058/g.44801  ORF Transcript_37058/g.44801 Transcript_37058/m.44801 type:complete len:231 (+) Transcript_37058:474-1166(+)